MRVAIVHDYLTQRGGAERVVLSLHRMFPDAPVFTALYDAQATFPEFRRCDVRTSFLQHVPHRALSGRGLLPLFPAAFGSLDLRGFDLVISSTSGFAHGVRTDGAHLAYCHTPPRFLYQVDRYLGPGGPLGPWARLPLAPVLGCLRRWDARAARRPDRYVANSTTTARKVEAIYGRACDVIHPPVRQLQEPAGDSPVPPARLEDREGDPFFLVAARLLPYKRVDLVIEACAVLGARLVVAGTGPAEQELRAVASRVWGAGRRKVDFVGTVADEQLAWLMSNCTAVVQAGEEDLGLVPLEASAMGVPVVAFARGGALETVVDGVTGVLFEEQAPGAMADALVEVGERTWDRDSMRRHAESFSEVRFHACVREEAERLVGSGPGAVRRPATSIAPSGDLVSAIGGAS